MPKWFRIEKRFLNTWFPNTIEGWLVTVGMVMSVSLTFLFAYIRTSSIVIALNVSFPFIALILAITIATASYFGEKPVWGKEHKGEKNYNSDGPWSYLVLSLVFVPLSYLYLNFSFLSSLILIAVALLLFIVFLNLIKPLNQR